MNARSQERGNDKIINNPSSCKICQRARVQNLFKYLKNEEPCLKIYFQPVSTNEAMAVQHTFVNKKLFADDNLCIEEVVNY